MKILQVSQKFHPSVASGSTEVAYCISVELVKKGHSVTAYASNMKDKYTKISSKVEEIHGVKVHRFQTIGIMATREMKIFLTPMIIPKLKSKTCFFDVIHLHGYRSLQNIVVYHYAKKNNVPYVLHAHGSLPRIKAKKRLKWIFDMLFGYRLLRNASKVIALSQAEVQQYMYMGVPEEKIVVIPNGIDLSEYVNLPLKGSFKKKFNIYTNKKIILYLGRIHKMKGIEFLIKTFAYLIKNIKCDNAILVIAGPDDGYLSETNQLINHLKITDKVVFTGMLSEKEKICAYVDSSVVVNVEPRNVFGLVPLEAAACSTPVVVSKSNAISEIIFEGEFGFSVEYGDINELAEIINKILHNDEIAIELGLKGRKFVFENANWSNIITKIEKTYSEAIRARA